jgi:hypothetical protein
VTGWRGATLAAAVALLYGGLLVTAMALPFAAAMPLGLAALLGYTMLMRPVAAWAGTGAQLCITLAVLAALAALLALAGGGLAKLTGAPPPWPGPVAALAGVALARLAWSARQAGEMDAFLDEALAAVEGQAARLAPEDEADRRRMLSDLPEAEARLVREAVAEAVAAGDEGAALDRALDPVEDAGLWDVAAIELAGLPAPAAPRARAALALRPEIAGRQLGDLEVENAVMAALASDARVAADVARRALAAVEEVAHLWRFLPPTWALREAAGRLGDPAEAPLQALAERIEALAAEDGEMP